MSPELHQQMRKLFDEALERPKDGRLAFLQSACAGQPEVFEAVSRLLAAHVESETFLEQTPQQNPAPPKQIGRYIVTGELGRGAMGIVYEAIDPLIGRSVAVKVIHLQSLTGSADAEFLTDRLFREARSAGSLSHPGIVTIFDVGKEGDTAFIAMERVEGQSLQQILVSGRTVTIAGALDILRQTASALDYAHSNNVVHRDIKPANIMLHKTATVKITDFGIAKINSPQQQTATGMAMGTPSYMSPEQIEMKPLDGRSDQFALAVVAYELLTGGCPFKADSLASLVLLVVLGDRPSACVANPALPAAVDGVLRRGLSKLPGDRFASCVEFAAKLDAAFSESPSLAPRTETPVLNDVPSPEALPTVIGPPIPVRTRPTSSRRYVFAAGGLLVVAAAVLVYKSVVSTPPAKEAVPVKAPAPAVAIDESAGKTPPNASVEVKPTTIGAGGTVPERVIAPEPTPPKENKKDKDDESRANDLYMAATVKKLAHQSAEALALFRQSASLGDARAENEIGKLYLAGEGVGKDPKEAVTWFRKAAEAGNSSGMVLLAAMYAQGSGVSRDDKEAVRWFRKAADAGDRVGMDGLGQVYASGRGVPKDDGEAAGWFRKAADAGNPAGMYHLGTMYEKGSGVAKDLNRAMELYQKAAGLGSREAQARLAQPAAQQANGSPQGLAPGGSVHVRVAGNQAWTDTGIDVKLGDTVNVGAAGSVAPAKDRGVSPQSPDGSMAAAGNGSASYPAPQLPPWSLIGRIGLNGPIFGVGTKRVFKATTSGRLYFGINDNSVQGNSGIWTALVVVQSARRGP